MQIIAKVIDYEISKRDLDRECSKVQAELEESGKLHALNRLIDRCLLLAQAIQAGCCISEMEYDDALLELIENEEPLGLSSEAIQDLSGGEIETMLRRQLIIKKYLQSLYKTDLPVTSEKLREFYDENMKIFETPEKVRCSHILLRWQANETALTAREIRAKIHTAEDFNHLCREYSDCPSNATCGDLGWFSKGLMVPEIDEVAFSLQLNEISQPFASPHGYHILMLTDRQEACFIPFEEIQDSLQAHLQQIEREYVIRKHVAFLRQQYADSIIIYESDLAVSHNS